jgi:hypothetical protein
MNIFKKIYNKISLKAIKEYKFDEDSIPDEYDSCDKTLLDSDDIPKIDMTINNRNEAEVNPEDEEIPSPVIEGDVKIDFVKDPNIIGNDIGLYEEDKVNE